jgi:hypothetical protein
MASEFFNRFWKCSTLRQAYLGYPLLDRSKPVDAALDGTARRPYHWIIGFN